VHSNAHASIHHAGGIHSSPSIAQAVFLKIMHYFFSTGEELSQPKYMQIK